MKSYCKILAIPMFFTLLVCMMCSRPNIQLEKVRNERNGIVELVAAVDTNSLKLDYLIGQMQGKLIATEHETEFQKAQLSQFINNQ